MAKHNDLRFDPEKIFNPAVLRTNVFLSSLYLTAYELLKIAVVDGTKQFFIVQAEITPEKEQIMLETLDREVVQRFKETYLEEVATYEREVGITISEREPVGLLPSCIWLQKQGALSEEDVEEIQTIRNHRNEMAQQIPFLLSNQGPEIKLEHFGNIRRLLHKIDVFWVRKDALFTPATIEEIDVQEASDDEVISMRVAMLDVITDTIVNYLRELVDSKENIQYDENL